MPGKGRARYRESSKKRSGPEDRDQVVRGCEQSAHGTAEQSAALRHVTAGPRHSVSSNDVLALQCAVGNRATRRLLTEQRADGGPVQEKPISVRTLPSQPAAIQRDPPPPRPSKKGRAKLTRLQAHLRLRKEYQQVHAGIRHKEFLESVFQSTWITKQSHLHQEGGKPGRFTSESYRRIAELLGQYDAVISGDPTDLAKRGALVDELGRKADEWWGKFKIWSRRGRRRAISRLREQVADEKQKIAELKSRLPRMTALTREPGRRKPLAQRAHLLEAYDFPRHREAGNLYLLYQVWDPGFKGWPPASAPPEEFYQVLGKWEAKGWKEIPEFQPENLLKVLPAKSVDKLLDLLKGWMKGDKTRSVTYLAEDERRQFRLGFAGTKASYEASGQKFETGLYVMCPDGEFYGGQEKVEIPGSKEKEKGKGKRAFTYYHHSSFLAGLPVGAAGHMKSDPGELKLDLESGHYQPETRHMVSAVRGLERKQVPLSKVTVRAFDKNLIAAWLPAPRFLKELRALKKVELDKVSRQDVAAQAPFMSVVIGYKKDKPRAFAQLRDAVKLV